MKLAIFGATGTVGGALLTQALDAGHQGPRARQNTLEDQSNGRVGGRNRTDRPPQIRT